MKKYFGLMLLFSLFGCSSKEGYQSISAEDAFTKIQSGVVLIDVRELNEYAQSHIPQSVNIPLGTIDTKMEEVITNKDSEIIVYCRSGARSKQAAQKLFKLGYKNVYDLGGIQSWPYDTEK